MGKEAEEGGKHHCNGVAHALLVISSQSLGTNHV